MITQPPIDYSRKQQDTQNRWFASAAKKDETKQSHNPTTASKPKPNPMPWLAKPAAPIAPIASTSSSPSLPVKKSSPNKRLPSDDIDSPTSQPAKKRRTQLPSSSSHRPINPTPSSSKSTVPPSPDVKKPASTPTRRLLNLHDLPPPVENKRFPAIATTTATGSSWPSKIVVSSSPSTSTDIKKCSSKKRSRSPDDELPPTVEKKRKTQAGLATGTSKGKSVVELPEIIVMEDERHVLHGLRTEGIPNCCHNIINNCLNGKRKDVTGALVTHRTTTAHRKGWEKKYGETSPEPWLGKELPEGKQFFECGLEGCYAKFMTATAQQTHVDKEHTSIVDVDEEPSFDPADDDGEYDWFAEELEDSDRASEYHPEEVDAFALSAVTASPTVQTAPLASSPQSQHQLSQPEPELDDGGDFEEVLVTVPSAVTAIQTGRGSAAGVEPVSTKESGSDTESGSGSDSDSGSDLEEVKIDTPATSVQGYAPAPQPGPTEPAPSSPTPQPQVSSFLSAMPRVLSAVPRRLRAPSSHPVASSSRLTPAAVHTRLEQVVDSDLKSIIEAGVLSGRTPASTTKTEPPSPLRPPPAHAPVPCPSSSNTSSLPPRALLSPLKRSLLRLSKSSTSSSTIAQPTARSPSKAPTPTTPPQPIASSSSAGTVPIVPTVPRAQFDAPCSPLSSRPALGSLFRMPDGTEVPWPVFPLQGPESDEYFFPPPERK